MMLQERNHVLTHFRDVLWHQPGPVTRVKWPQETSVTRNSMKCDGIRSVNTDMRDRWRDKKGGDTIAESSEQETSIKGHSAYKFKKWSYMTPLNRLRDGQDLSSRLPKGKFNFI